MQYGVIILAAGKGTRMRSALPKLLHPVGGRPMLGHLLEVASHLSQQSPIVIIGHGAEQLQQAFASQTISWVEQKQQLGTGHAVMQTLPQLQDDITYLILVGDAPLIREPSLAQLAEQSTLTGLAVLTVKLNNPEGYGRIIRDTAGQVTAIVEEKDATPDEKKINEINSGIFAIRGDRLKELLPKITNQNAQSEYYLTDIVALAARAGYGVKPLMITDETEVLGCNDKVQLAQLERIYQQRQAQAALLAGATLADPARFDVRGELQIGNDCFIDINCVFEGKVTLGDQVHIGPNCLISDSVIGSQTVIKANTVIESSVVGGENDIGPFARLRPQTELAEQAKVGNFVETKNAKIAKGSKVNHLSYVGDAVVEENVNVGAGTITCNYDGVSKHQTTIKAEAFIGSNTALVAPVTIGKGSTVAAGSTITKDVNSGTLAITRAKQAEIADWKRPKKEKS